ncbi:purine nucleoside phosphorylase-like isoform X1 [Varanus komodoensis]|uniref:purine nucleoside phosphorylase-like isoform X1 n=1 Tax=Varanus komodoensis TaxID=61221 RepID=UPI001CF79A72|nr:purine nucleoside phosphorylase-like isoform X1 [Varanus komodoensis]
MHCHGFVIGPLARCGLTGCPGCIPKERVVGLAGGGRGEPGLAGPLPQPSQPGSRVHHQLSSQWQGPRGAGLSLCIKRCPATQREAVQKACHESCTPGPPTPSKPLLTCSPGCSQSTSVTGHDGQLIFGELRGKLCVVMKGRCHMYEGYPLWQVTFPIRVFRLMGVETLLVTNAAGALTDSYSPGDLMVICDHISLPGLAGQSPLVGPNDERFGPRFPALSDAYDRRIRTLAKETAKHLGYTSIVREGVYAMVGGPSFESVAEARLLHALGADAVGMSTAAEVVVARHCGLRVFGLSLVTNMVSKDYDPEESVDHHSVLDVCQRGAFTLRTFLTELVGRLDCSNSSDPKDTETSYQNGA